MKMCSCCDSKCGQNEEKFPNGREPLGKIGVWDLHRLRTSDL